MNNPRSPLLVINMPSLYLVVELVAYFNCAPPRLFVVHGGLHHGTLPRPVSRSGRRVVPLCSLFEFYSLQDVYHL